MVFKLENIEFCASDEGFNPNLFWIWFSSSAGCAFSFCAMGFNPNLFWIWFSSVKLNATAAAVEVSILICSGFGFQELYKISRKVFPWSFNPNLFWIWFSSEVVSPASLPVFCFNPNLFWIWFLSVRYYSTFKTTFKFQS